MITWWITVNTWNEIDILLWNIFCLTNELIYYHFFNNSDEFVAHGSAVTCLALGQKSGRVMVTGGDDAKINLWAIGKPNCIMVSKHFFFAFFLWLSFPKLFIVLLYHCIIYCTILFNPTGLIKSYYSIHSFESIESCCHRPLMMTIQNKYLLHINTHTYNGQSFDRSNKRKKKFLFHWKFSNWFTCQSLCVCVCVWCQASDFFPSYHNLYVGLFYFFPLLLDITNHYNHVVVVVVRKSGSHSFYFYFNHHHTIHW